MNDSRSKMPSRKEIMEYWHVKNHKVDEMTRLEKLGKNQPFKAIEALYHGEKSDNLAKVLDDIEKEVFCFACGLPKKVQRAHILAVSEGGSHKVDNIHLLCYSCHEQSEMLSGESYWQWFKDKDESLALEYWFKDKQPLFDRLLKHLESIKPIDEWNYGEKNQAINEYLDKNKS